MMSIQIILLENSHDSGPQGPPQEGGRSNKPGQQPGQTPGQQTQHPSEEPVHGVSKMRTGDHITDSKLFNYSMSAELFTSKGRLHGRPPLRYRRFARAAEAIRFAIEDLPSQLLVVTHLEVDELRYSSAEIRRLYESPDYPLGRKAAVCAHNRTLTQQDRGVQQTISTEGYRSNVSGRRLSGRER